MTSDAKVRANRRNARKSTGPRTGAGKAVVARNALRHGLRVPLMRDPAVAPDVDAAAHAIERSVIGAWVSGAEADAQCHELACRVAEAQIDLVRARRARLPLLGVLESDPQAIVQLARIDRYERRAFSRRKFAIRAFDHAVLGAAAGAGHFGRTKPNEKT